MADEVKVSVVVPVYNVERYLRRCLDSLCAQTLREIEIICVNDGSTDGSAVILGEYAAADRRIRIVTRSNGGLSAARNSGMAVATARYLVFCDSDDYVEPGWCGRLYASVTEAGADLGVCGVVCEDTDGSPVERGVPALLDRGRTGPLAIDGRFMLETDGCAWDKIYRRDLIEANGVRFIEGLKHEDEFFFWEYCAVASTASVYRDPDYHYVIRSGGIMGSERKNSSLMLDYVRGFTQVHGRISRGPGWTRLRDSFLRRQLSFFQYAALSLSREDILAYIDGIAPVVMAYGYGRALLERLTTPEQEALCRIAKRDPDIEFCTKRSCFGLVKVKRTAVRRSVYVCGIPVARIPVHDYDEV